jgi:hypothetical protein
MVWVSSDSGKAVPLDPAPVPDGNIQERGSEHEILEP